jgi:hypothetical protein
MKHYKGTEKVEPGLYFNLRQLSFKSVDDEGPLDGKTEDIYRRVPMLALLVVGPLLGFVYVVFLPLVGFAMVAWLLGVKTAHVAVGAARGAARVLKPGWEPSMAFLSRSRPTKAPRDAADEWIEEVEKKLDPPGRGAA